MGSVGWQTRRLWVFLGAGGRQKHSSKTLFMHRHPGCKKKRHREKAKTTVLANPITAVIVGDASPAPQRSFFLAVLNPHDPAGPWLRLCHFPQFRQPRFDPSQGIRSHTPQLRVLIRQLKVPHASLQRRSRIPHAATKTWCSQNTQVFKKKKKKKPSLL